MTLTGNLEQKFKKSLYPRIRPGPSQAEHLSEADLFDLKTFGIKTEYLLHYQVKKNHG